MEKELIKNITSLLNKGFEVRIEYGKGGQGGVPVEVFIDDKKNGRDCNHNSKEYDLLGSDMRIKIAEDIEEWDTDEVVGNYCVNNDYLLADRYECSFYLDDEPERLFLDIKGYGDWGEGEFTTEGGMEILQFEE